MGGIKLINDCATSIYRQTNGRFKEGQMKELIPVEIIERKIYLIRGEKVMLDSDLAVLYEVETSNLNKAVKRNIDRFPEDFMFQLTMEEA